MSAAHRSNDPAKAIEARIHAELARVQRPQAVIRALLRCAERLFQRAGFLVAKGGALEGFGSLENAFGKALSAQRWAPIPQPLQAVLHSRTHRMGPCRADDEVWFAQLQISTPKAFLLAPLTVHDRPVALLYADQGDADFAPPHVALMLSILSIAEQRIEALQSDETPPPLPKSENKPSPVPAVDGQKNSLTTTPDVEDATESFPTPAHLDPFDTSKDLPELARCHPSYAEWLKAPSVLRERALAALDGDDEKTRFFALYALVGIAEPDDVAVLLAALTDLQMPIRSMALRVLAALPKLPQAERLWPALYRRLDDGDPQVQEQAVLALEALRDPAAVPRLLPFVEAEDRMLSERARHALFLIAGIDHGHDLGRWQRWWVNHRGQTRAGWLCAALSFAQPLAWRRSAHRELCDLFATARALPMGDDEVAWTEVQHDWQKRLTWERPTEPLARVHRLMSAFSSVGEGVASAA